ncbi:MAG: hypothetical protein ACHREM_26005, partial [Polyangiales bacterium]
MRLRTLSSTFFALAAIGAVLNAPACSSTPATTPPADSGTGETGCGGPAPGVAGPADPDCPATPDPKNPPPACGPDGVQSCRCSQRTDVSTCGQIGACNAYTAQSGSVS